jgi:hypothetical protein
MQRKNTERLMLEMRGQSRKQDELSQNAAK